MIMALIVEVLQLLLPLIMVVPLLMVVMALVEMLLPP